MSRPDPFKLRSPFFLPPWRRGLTVGACVLWGAIELYLGNPGWFAIFIALGGYLGYEFFVMFDAAEYSGDEGKDADE